MGPLRIDQKRKLKCQTGGLDKWESVLSVEKDPRFVTQQGPCGSSGVGSSCPKRQARAAKVTQPHSFSFYHASGSTSSSMKYIGVPKFGPPPTVSWCAVFLGLLWWLKLADGWSHGNQRFNYSMQQNTHFEGTPSAILKTRSWDSTIHKPFLESWGPVAGNSKSSWFLRLHFQPLLWCVHYG